jgi:Flp pilus assembly protein TadG
MQSNSGVKARPRRFYLPRPLERWCADASGTTAVEFGMVAMPFLMLLFGIVAIGLYFFTTFTLENALEQAARLIRTGQAQQANMTAEQFKNKVCEFTPGFIDCQNKILVNVRSYAEADLTPVITRGDCLTNGNLNNAGVYSPGGSSSVVLVTLCYEWDLAQKLPFLHFADMNGGASLIQASTAFRTEPYQTN